METEEGGDRKGQEGTAFFKDGVPLFCLIPPDETTLLRSLVPHRKQEGVRERGERTSCFRTCFLVPSGELFEGVCLLKAGRGGSKSP